MKRIIRKLNEREIQSAIELSLEVFMVFEAPEYSQEGIDEFKQFLNNQNEVSKLVFFGVFSQNTILGVLAMRQNHISLLFVKQEYHKRGIGKELFMYMLQQTNGETITVNGRTGEVISSLGTIRINNFNAHFLRLVHGLNTLKCTGKVSNLKLTYENFIRIGG